MAANPQHARAAGKSILVRLNAGLRQRGFIVIVVAQ
jgi:hypothetical protein